VVSYASIRSEALVTVSKILEHNSNAPAAVRFSTAQFFEPKAMGYWWLGIWLVLVAPQDGLGRVSTSVEAIVFSRAVVRWRLVAPNANMGHLGGGSYSGGLQPRSNADRPGGGSPRTAAASV